MRDHNGEARQPRRGSYAVEALRFAFVIVMVGFLLATLIQFGYWLVVNLQEIKGAI